MTQHSGKKRGFSSIITYAVVSFTRYSYIPWLLIYLHNRKYSSWSHVVLAYGTLLTVLQIGILCGKSISAQCKKLSTTFYSLVFMTMTSSYILIAFITRFSIMMALFWIIGFTSTILSDFSLSLHGHNPMVVFHKPTHSVDSEQSSLHYHREELQRQLLFFSFTTLVGGYLYDHRFHSEFPLYYLSLTLAIVVAFIIAYYWILKYALRKRSKAQGHGHTAHNKHHPSASTTSTSSSTSSSTSATRHHPTPTHLRKILPPYTGKVPINFLSWYRGDVKRAQDAYGKTLQFREDYSVDDLLTSPQPCFEEILTHYPHAIHGYSLDGCAVVYEVLGKGNAKELIGSGATIDDIVWHFNLRNEFIFKTMLNPAVLTQAIEEYAPQHAISYPVFPYTPPPDTLPYLDTSQPFIPRLLTVIDVEGISISSVTTDVISFMKKSGEMIDAYYPEQVSRLVVCKAPRWFSAVWSMIANVLPEGVQKKVDILYDAKGLDKYIHPSQRPVAYGGTDTNPLGQYPHHLAFRQLAQRWRDKESAAASAIQQLSVVPSSGVGMSTTSTASTSSPRGQETSSSSSSSSTWKTVDISNTTSTTSGSKGSSGGGGGVWGWVSARVSPYLPKAAGGSSGGGKKGSGSGSGGGEPKSAFLGEKNAYVYNPQSRQWELVEHPQSEGMVPEGIATLGGSGDSVGHLRTHGTHVGQGGGQFGHLRTNMSGVQTYPPSRFPTLRSASRGSGESESDDVSSSDSDGEHTGNTGMTFLARRHTPPPTPSSTSHRKKHKRRNSLSKEQLEEHGLVLAIHAAHYAANYASSTRSTTTGGVPGPGLRGSSSQLFLQHMESMAAASGFGHGNTGNGHGNTGNGHGNTGNGMEGYTGSLAASSDLEGGNGNTGNGGTGNGNGIATGMHTPLSISLPPATPSHLPPLHSPSTGNTTTHTGNYTGNSTTYTGITYTGNSHTGITYPPTHTTSSTTSSTAEVFKPPSTTTSTSHSAHHKVPALQSLLVGGSFILLLFLQQLLLTLLPVWWTSTLTSGGLEYNHCDVALVLSSIAMALYYMVTYWYDTGMMMVRLSPVRTLRIAASILAVCLWVVPVYLRWYTVPVVDYVHHYQHHETTSSGTAVLIHHSYPIPTLSHGIGNGIGISDGIGNMYGTGNSYGTGNGNMYGNGIGNGMLPVASVLPVGYVGNLAEHTNGTMLVYQYLTTSTPHTAFLSLLPLTFFFTIIFSMIYLSIRCMNILLYLTFSPVFYAPSEIRTTLTTLFSLVGPILSCLFYVFIYSMHWKYPLDTSFVMNISASAVLLVYTLSILLRVQFRGEFGIVYDEEDLAYYTMYLWGEEPTMSSSSSSSGNGTSGNGTSGNGNSGTNGTNGALHQRHGNTASTYVPTFSTGNNTGNTGGNTGFTGGNTGFTSGNTGSGNTGMYPRMSQSSSQSRIALCNNSVWSLPYSDWQFFRACLRHPTTSYATNMNTSLWYGNMKEDLKDV